MSSSEQQRIKDRKLFYATNALADAVTTTAVADAVAVALHRHVSDLRVDLHLPSSIHFDRGVELAPG